MGDRLRLGDATLTIADVLISEPDRPVNFFALGPRMLIHAGDLAALNLVTPGSRVTYRWLLRASQDSQVDAIAADISAVADRTLVDVETYRTARTGVERFFTNFLFFLSLVGIFTLLLAGIGIQSALTAFLRERHSTIAIAKTLGATSRFVTVNFYLVVVVLGAIGALLGIVLGWLLQWTLPGLLAGFLPPDIELVIAPRAVIESALLGLLVVLLFTFLPLYRLEGLRPSFIFRKEEPPVVNRRSLRAHRAAHPGPLYRPGHLAVGRPAHGALVRCRRRCCCWSITALLTEAALWLLRRLDDPLADLAARRCAASFARATAPVPSSSPSPARWASSSASS